MQIIFSSTCIIKCITVNFLFHTQFLKVKKEESRCEEFIIALASRRGLVLQDKGGQQGSLI